MGNINYFSSEMAVSMSKFASLYVFPALSFADTELGLLPLEYSHTFSKLLLSFIWKKL